MIVLAKLGIGMIGTALAAGAALSSEGFIHVRVHEKRPGGDNVFVIVPAAIVPIAAHFIPRDNLSEASENIRPYLGIIDAAIPALEHCRDGVFVDVTDNDEHVVVSKSGGSLIVDVNDHDEVVHVSVPLRAAQNSIHQLAALQTQPDAHAIEFTSLEQTPALFAGEFPAKSKNLLGPAETFTVRSTWFD